MPVAMVVDTTLEPRCVAIASRRRSVSGRAAPSVSSHVATQTPGARRTRRQPSIQQVQIIGRHVIPLEVNRGPVGARISVLGRGFSPQNRILFNGAPARTNFESPNSLSFFVPALPPAANYQVALSGAAGTSPVGTFRIDTSTITVAPTALTLRTGDRTTLTFTLANAAPPGGTLLDVDRKSTRLNSSHT